MEIVPAEGEAPMARKRVILLLVELVASYTTLFTTTHVNPFPVAVG